MTARKPWTPVKLYNDPSTHRMHWVKEAGRQNSPWSSSRFAAAAVENGDGPGLRILEYFETVGSEC